MEVFKSASVSFVWSAGRCWCKRAIPPATIHPEVIAGIFNCPSSKTDVTGLRLKGSELWSKIRFYESFWLWLDLQTNNILTNNTLTNNILTNNILTNNILTNNILTNNILTNKFLANENYSDRQVPGKQTPEKQNTDKQNESWNTP